MSHCFIIKIILTIYFPIKFLNQKIGISVPSVVSILFKELVETNFRSYLKEYLEKVLLKAIKKNKFYIPCLCYES